LESAATVLADRGYENARFADVSLASGVAISTLQNYFGSREDMLIEAMRQATDDEVRALEAAAADDAEPWSRLAAMIDRHLKTPVRSHRLVLEFWRSSMRDGELRDYCQEGWKRYRAPFLAAVVEGRDAGEFALQTDPEDIVDLLLTSLAGALIPRVLGFGEPSADRLRKTLLRQTAQMLGRADSD
jgi:AcrR family transcriptional regulator